MTIAAKSYKLEIPKIQNLIEQLRLGDTVTITDETGAPVAMVVGLRADAKPSVAHSDWKTRWQDLSQRVGETWRTNQNAVEVLTEMRR